ncbi:MAG: hypothetical protein HQL86_03730 [Magnetococcales bacterium]|nr:hypothetical protein [Magnetococcales bacterium]
MRAFNSLKHFRKRYHVDADTLVFIALSGDRAVAKTVPIGRLDLVPMTMIARPHEDDSYILGFLDTDKKPRFLTDVSDGNGLATTEDPTLALAFTGDPSDACPCTHKGNGIGKYLICSKNGLEFSDKPGTLPTIASHAGQATVTNVLDAPLRARFSQTHNSKTYYLSCRADKTVVLSTDAQPYLELAGDHFPDAVKVGYTLRQPVLWDDEKNPLLMDGGTVMVPTKVTGWVGVWTHFASSTSGFPLLDVAELVPFIDRAARKICFLLINHPATTEYYTLQSVVADQRANLANSEHASNAKDGYHVVWGKTNLEENLFERSGIWFDFDEDPIFDHDYFWIDVAHSGRLLTSREGATPKHGRSLSIQDKKSMSRNQLWRFGGANCFVQVDGRELASRRQTESAEGSATSDLYVAEAGQTGESILRFSKGTFQHYEGDSVWQVGLNADRNVIKIDSTQDEHTVDSTPGNKWNISPFHPHPNWKKDRLQPFSDGRRFCIVYGNMVLAHANDGKIELLRNDTADIHKIYWQFKAGHIFADDFGKSLSIDSNGNLLLTYRLNNGHALWGATDEGALILRDGSHLALTYKNDQTPPVCTAWQHGNVMQKWQIVASDDKHESLLPVENMLLPLSWITKPEHRERGIRGAGSVCFGQVAWGHPFISIIFAYGSQDDAGSAGYYCRPNEQNYIDRDNGLLRNLKFSGVPYLVRGQMVGGMEKERPRLLYIVYLNADGIPCYREIYGNDPDEIQFGVKERGTGKRVPLKCDKAPEVVQNTRDGDFLAVAWPAGEKRFVFYTNNGASRKLESFDHHENFMDLENGKTYNLTSQPIWFSKNLRNTWILFNDVIYRLMTCDGKLYWDALEPKHVWHSVSERNAHGKSSNSPPEVSLPFRLIDDEASPSVIVDGNRILLGLTSEDGAIWIGRFDSATHTMASCHRVAGVPKAKHRPNLFALPNGRLLVGIHGPDHDLSVVTIQLPSD